MGIADIIKYEGNNNTFIWKHPCEDFNTATQLIVHESQEAIFFANGQALDLFGPGRYTLETQNIPMIKKFFNKTTDDRTPFHCEIYFINKTEQMAIKWGTDSRIQFIEPTYNFPLSIGACGEMSLRASDSRKLLIKVIGTERAFTQENFIRFFKSFLMTRVKTYLAQIIKDNHINIFEIDAHLNDISETLKSKISTDYDNYGISLETFFVTTISRPDGERTYEKYKDLYYRQYADIAEAELRQKVGVIDQTTESKKLVIEAESLAQKRQIEGYTYQQERSYDVAETVAANEGIGEFSNMGIGLGMIAGVGGNIGSTVGGVINNAITEINDAAPKNNFCHHCGRPVNQNDVFCDNCGTKLVSKLVCPNCGFEFEKDSKFCPKCGTKREV